MGNDIWTFRTQNIANGKGKPNTCVLSPKKLLSQLYNIKLNPSGGQTNLPNCENALVKPLPSCRKKTANRKTAFNDEPETVGQS